MDESFPSVGVQCCVVFEEKARQLGGEFGGFFGVA